MSVRTILIVVLALVFGLSAALGINVLLAKMATRPVIDTVPVVIAAADIPRFTTLSADQLRTRDYPKGLVPTSALVSIEEALDRVVATPLIKDEPILDSKLASKGAGRGMAAAIPKGMRAFTIRTPNVASGVAGFILPGNKVDVLLTITSQAADDLSGGSTTTMLQGVDILAVDQRVEAPSENKMDPNQLRSVTLLVTPDQAAKLDLGQSKGTLTLSLRNPEEKESVTPRVATLADLRFRQEKPWDERLKGLLEVSAKLWAKRPAVEKKPVEIKPVIRAAAADEDPPAIKVRTLRGTIQSSVELK